MTKLLLLIFGGLKLGKVLMSAGTMLASIAVYALFYGWRFAAGFVALLLVHEAGHYLAQRRGLDVGLPTFIPFVGAWIQLKEMPHDAETEAYVGPPGRSSARSARWPATRPRATPTATCCSRCRIRASS